MGSYKKKWTLGVSYGDLLYNSNYDDDRPKLKHLHHKFSHTPYTLIKQWIMKVNLTGCNE